MEENKEYSIRQRHEYNLYKMQNKSDKELTIEEYFELQEQRKNGFNQANQDV